MLPLPLRLVLFCAPSLLFCSLYCPLGFAQFRVFPLFQEAIHFKLRSGRLPENELWMLREEVASAAYPRSPQMPFDLRASVSEHPLPRQLAHKFLARDRRHSTPHHHARPSELHPRLLPLPSPSRRDRCGSRSQRYQRTQLHSKTLGPTHGRESNSGNAQIEQRVGRGELHTRTQPGRRKHSTINFNANATSCIHN